MIEINRAHLVMLATQGCINKKTAVACLDALDSIPENLKLDPHLEDVHMNVEAQVISKIGETDGGQLNLAKSRNDQVASAIRLVLRNFLLQIMKALIELRTALIVKSQKHLRSVMPGYTHLQHAQPVTAAHHLLSYEESLSRNCERLADCYSRVNLSPLGAAALATSTLPVNRRLTAQLLGFDGLLTNSIDAVSSRDFAVEAIFNFALLMTDLSALAEELILWTSQEFSLASLPDEYTSTSSIMPQKKNPVVAELIRARAATVYGDLLSSLAILKALPRSYNLDLQELTPHLWNAARICLSSTQVSTRMISGLALDTRRMRELTTDDMSTATDLADFLVVKYGLSFRTAHHIVGMLARESQRARRPFVRVVQRRLRHVMRTQTGRKISVSRDEIASVLDSTQAVARRSVFGGPSPRQVVKTIQRSRAVLRRLRAWVRKKESKLQQAASALKSRTAALRGGEN